MNKNDLINMCRQADFPAAVYDRSLEAVWRNDAAKSCLPLCSARFEPQFADTDKILLGLEQNGVVSVPLSQFPHSGACATLCVIGEWVFAAVSSYAETSSNLPSLLTGADDFTASVRTDVHEMFLKIDALASTAETIEELNNISELRRAALSVLRSSRDVALYSELASGAYPLFLRCTDISGVVKAICAAIECVNAGDIKLDYSGVQDAVFCKTDPLLFSRAVINVIYNSYRFTRDDNVVTVRLSADGGFAALTVRDNGAGIKPEVIPMVTEPYFSREPANDSGERPGLGLGLSIASAAFKLFGGSLIISSEFGEGCAVAMRLPLCEEDPESTVTEKTSKYVADRFSEVYVTFSKICAIPE